MQPATPTPTHRPNRPPFLIRAASSADFTQVASWLPEALIGTPPAKLLIAADAATFSVAGVAALRVFSDRVARFQLHVDPPFRRRGCGTALLESVQQAARQANARSLLTVKSYEPTANDEPTRTGVAFLQARGVPIAQDIRRYRAEVKAAVAVLRPLYERWAQRPANTRNIRIVTADQVDPHIVAAFVVRHLGGFADHLANRLKGTGKPPFKLSHSWIALEADAVIGALLSVEYTSESGLIETRAAAADHRGAGINLALMYLTAAGSDREGYKTFDFEGDTRDRDTAKLAQRLGATEVGARQCYGFEFPEVLEPPAPVARAPVPSSDPTRASATASFAEILTQLNLSLAITSPEVGKLILLRPDGEQVNTHFHHHAGRPTALAVEGDRLALGLRTEIWEYRNAPDIASRLPPEGKHDACYLPRGCHTTGNIALGELAWTAHARDGGFPNADDLWFVNTRFSCLCTRDSRYSFVPRWQPPFISALAPDDRCHLSGFCQVPPPPDTSVWHCETLDSTGFATAPAPRWYVTALGRTDTPAGWRANVRTGGILMESGTNEIVASGLCLPHSPRWYADRLWLLESGTGTLGVVDLRTGRCEPVVQLPGFTRGLAFFGRYAFVGVSRIRDGATPSEQMPAERSCGIWVIDITTGRIVGWLKFPDNLQELTAVEVLASRRFPEVLNDDPRFLEDAFVLPETGKR